MIQLLVANRLLINYLTEKIIRENAFEHKKKKPGLHLTPG